MPRYPKTQVDAQYLKLPDKLKDAMFSADIAERIFQSGKKFGFTIEKIGFLAEETGYVILGLARPSEFVRILKERLGVSEDLARQIASEVNHQIFFPLRELLKETHQIEVGESEIQRGATPEVLKKPPSPATVSEVRKPLSPPPVPQPVAPPPAPRPPTLPAPPRPAPLPSPTTPPPSKPEVPKPSAEPPPPKPSTVPTGPFKPGLTVPPTPPRPESTRRETDPYREPIE